MEEEHIQSYFLQRIYCDISTFSYLKQNKLFTQEMVQSSIYWLVPYIWSIKNVTLWTPALISTREQELNILNGVLVGF